MKNTITIELADTDIVFIYGHFQKQLAEIDKLASFPNCPFDKSTIKSQKLPYLSVVEKLSAQVPNLAKMDKYF